MSELDDWVAKTFDVPPELVARWAREREMKRLRLALWRLYLKRLWNETVSPLFR
jgi:hypothetical protein